MEDISTKLNDLDLDKETIEKVNLIEKNLEEITSTDRIILRKIIKQRNLKIYWGTAITGKPHIGYFLPLLKIKDFLLANCEVTILFADIHGFLDNLKAPIELIEIRYEYYFKLIKNTILGLLGDKKDLIKNIKFIKGSDYQKTSNYIFDLYKLSSYTTERDCKRAGADVVKQTSNSPLSSLIYPNMQALDEEYLNVDAQFGGVDQRKIFMHAKTFLPKLGYKKRIHLMNPMMPGLNSDKMSSSDENSKIDLLDTKKTINLKISKCFCEEGNIETGVLTIYKFILFKYFNEIEVINKKYKNYLDLENDFKSKEIHPCDLKNKCSEYINMMVEPIRESMKEETELIKKAYDSKKSKSPR